MIKSLGPSRLSIESTQRFASLSGTVLIQTALGASGRSVGEPPPRTCPNFRWAGLGLRAKSSGLIHAGQMAWTESSRKDRVRVSCWPRPGWHRCSRLPLPSFRFGGLALDCSAERIARADRLPLQTHLALKRLCRLAASRCVVLQCLEYRLHDPSAHRRGRW